MDEKGSGFSGSDAWLLLAVIYARDPADRTKIVEIGDFIEHAIFTDEELEGGLQRLQAAGHVIQENGRFRPSPTVVGWFEKASPKRSYVYKDLERVKKFLGIRKS
jgi:hypothetical protein